MISVKAQKLQSDLFKLRALRSNETSRDFLKSRKEALERALTTPLPAGTIVEDISLNGIAAEKLSVPDAIPNKILLFLHGGGFFGGSHKGGRAFCSRLALKTQHTVISPDYRLAPENPFPAALDDCCAVYRALLAQEINPKNIVIAGSSAGGNLVLALSLWCKDHGIPMPGLLITNSPATTYDAPSHTERQERDMAIGSGTAAINTLPQMYEIYTQGTNIDSPYVYPILGDFKGFPPVYITVGTEEILYDDSILLAKRLKELGVPYKLHIAEGMHHVFVSAFIPEAEQAIADMAEFIAKREDC